MKRIQIILALALGMTTTALFAQSAEQKGLQIAQDAMVVQQEQVSSIYWKLTHLSPQETMLVQQPIQPG